MVVKEDEVLSVDLDARSPLNRAKKVASASEKSASGVHFYYDRGPD